MQEYILAAIIFGVCMLSWGGFIGMMIFGIDYYERRLAIFLIAIAVCGISELIVYQKYWPNRKAEEMETSAFQTQKLLRIKASVSENEACKKAGFQGPRWVIGHWEDGKQDEFYWQYFGCIDKSNRFLHFISAPDCNHRNLTGCK